MTKMNAEQLIHRWFEVWTSREYLNIPVTEDFVHISPYGRIDGKAAYLELVRVNEAKFLDNSYKIHEVISQGDVAAVRYTVHSTDFDMEVSEWHYAKEGKIAKIIAYYNIESEIPESRQLKNG